MEKSSWDNKKEYEKLKNRYGLPKFIDLCADFNIEKRGEKETSFLIREIRNVIAEKVSAYLHFFEGLMNPGSSPMFIMSSIRNFDQDNKNEVKEIYKRLAKLQLAAMKLDTIYNENDEASFINSSFNEWQNLKKDIQKIIGTFNPNLDEESNRSKSGYFG